MYTETLHVGVFSPECRWLRKRGVYCKIIRHLVVNIEQSNTMADPKFANLPGIVSDQPDVYETADDIPEPETSDYYEEEPESDQIERLHISTKDSYNRFKGKYLTGYVDFSDRIGKQARPGYNALYV